MSDREHMVICHVHGVSYATFICQHLHFGQGLGFNQATEDPSDLYPDAWCDTCDALLQQEGEWTERLRTFADLTLLCAGCYDEVQERNKHARPQVR